ncbi:MAG: hypothetical protein U0X20_20865 [Caldilineaceae bacterium]
MSFDDLDVVGQPLANSSTVSLVLVSPSIEMRLKLTSAAASGAAWSTGCATKASVTMALSMVAAHWGGSCRPRPWQYPCSAPGDRQSVPCGSLARRVSVVMMAVAAAGHPSGEFVHDLGHTRLDLGHRQLHAGITPVLITNTECSCAKMRRPLIPPYTSTVASPSPRAGIGAAVR